MARIHLPSQFLFLLLLLLDRSLTARMLLLGRYGFFSSSSPSSSSRFSVFLSDATGAENIDHVPSQTHSAQTTPSTPATPPSCAYTRKHHNTSLVVPRTRHGTAPAWVYMEDHEGSYAGPQIAAHTLVAKAAGSGAVGPGAGLDRGPGAMAGLLEACVS